MYKVTKLFTCGFLADMQVTEVTTVEFEVGKYYTPCAGSSGYTVVACEKLK